MGDKARARRVMRKAGVPILPGSDGPIESEDKALKIAKDIGYPVIIKATAGGGGRGMRVVRSAGELPHAFKTAQREAEAAFGVADVYIEKYVESPRHIEFQILGDQHGSVIHLGERECSIQRRHQKLLEESPSPALSDKMRRKMGAVVIDAAKAVQYSNAGTFEFLMDTGGHFYFMEANTRLQVEHPVTEMVTGFDIVKEQIRIAAGERLSFSRDVTFTGHSIECRVNAGDPETFEPSPASFTPSACRAANVRVETSRTRCTVSPCHDR
jgi:acetyl-CoA carboxylase biotin carboxylase subunit